MSHEVQRKPFHGSMLAVHVPDSDAIQVWGIDEQSMTLLDGLFNHGGNKIVKIDNNSAVIRFKSSSGMFQFETYVHNI